MLAFIVGCSAENFGQSKATSPTRAGLSPYRCYCGGFGESIQQVRDVSENYIKSIKYYNSKVVILVIVICYILLCYNILEQVISNGTTWYLKLL